MQVNVIQGGSPELFAAMLFPETSPETKQWIHEQFNRDRSYLTDAGKKFMESANALYARMTDPSISRLARKMVRQIKGIAHPNAIVPVNGLSELQSAKPVMQRYIMAMPELRRLYHRQLCDGYSDSYVDHEPTAIGEAHYDYRRVMDGIVVDVELPDGTTTWKSVMYPDDLEEGDRELDMEEKFIIQDAWETAQYAMYKKLDPTDVFNGALEI